MKHKASYHLAHVLLFTSFCFLGPVWGANANEASSPFEAEPLEALPVEPFDGPFLLPSVDEAGVSLPAAEQPAAPSSVPSFDYSALPPETLQQMEEAARTVLGVMQEKDPAILARLPDALQSKVAPLLEGRASLAPDEIAAIMTLYGAFTSESLGNLGNVAPAAPLAVPTEIPLVAEPILPPVLAPSLGEAVPIPGGAIELPPLYAILSDKGGDHRAYGEFFSLPFADTVRALQLELQVEGPSILSVHTLHNAQAFGDVSLMLLSDDNDRRPLYRADRALLMSGTYQLVLSMRSEGAVSSVSAKIDLVRSPDPYEPNNEAASAAVIELPFRDTLFLEDARDEDWFRFDVDEAGVLSLGGARVRASIRAENAPEAVLLETDGSARYRVVERGSYLLRVGGGIESATGKVALRLYPPAEFATAINRLILLDAAGDEDLADQMAAIARATGVSMVEANEAPTIANALGEAVEDSAPSSSSWLLWLIALVVGCVGLFLGWRRWRRTNA